MSRNIVLIRGKKRAGKDTTAKLLKEYIEVTGHTVEIMSFAEPMKDIIAETLSISLEDLDRYKNGNDYLYVEDQLEAEYYILTNFRQILQRFGTEAMKKHFGNHVWTELMIKRIRECNADIVIIPDWRFPVEYNYLLGDGRKIQTIEVKNNRIKSDDTHSSETALDGWECDFTVENNGSIEELRKQIEG